MCTFGFTRILYPPCQNFLLEILVYQRISALPILELSGTRKMSLKGAILCDPTYNTKLLFEIDLLNNSTLAHIFLHPQTHWLGTAAAERTEWRREREGAKLCTIPVSVQSLVHTPWRFLLLDVDSKAFPPPPLRTTTLARSFRKRRRRPSSLPPTSKGFDKCYIQRDLGRR